ncbi:MAG: hypothetical protein II863_04380 [Kiritimatiellae bacterium]|nr:hypothetical protein [Kiritimatiellia bacterium]MBQ6915744.1 hypothetical protein [Kiritimatiellia bacterium]
MEGEARDEGASTVAAKQAARCQANRREKKIRVANLLPSLAVAIVWTLVKGGL